MAEIEDSLPIKEAIKIKLPGKSTKWDEWTQALEKQDIDTVKDLRSISDAVWSSLEFSAFLRTAMDQIRRSGKATAAATSATTTAAKGAAAKKTPATTPAKGAAAKKNSVKKTPVKKTPVKAANGAAKPVVQNTKTSIFFGDLPEDLNEAKVRKFFEDKISVNPKEVNAPSGNWKKKHKNAKFFVFVEFNTVEDKKKALELDGQEWLGKTVKVAEAKPPRAVTGEKEVKKVVKPERELRGGWEVDSQAELHFMIPHVYVPKLIGRAGENIKKTKKRTGCKIVFGESLPPVPEVGDDLQHCAIKGKLANLEKAITKIAGEMIDCDVEKGRQQAASAKVRLAMLIAGDRTPMVIGKKGSKIKQIQSANKVVLKVLPDEMFGERILIVEGPLLNVISAILDVATGLPCDTWQPIRCEQQNMDSRPSKGRNNKRGASAMTDRAPARGATRGAPGRDSLEFAASNRKRIRTSSYAQEQSSYKDFGSSISRTLVSSDSRPLLSSPVSSRRDPYASDRDRDYPPSSVLRDPYARSQTDPYSRSQSDPYGRPAPRSQTDPYARAQADLYARAPVRAQPADPYTRGAPVHARAQPSDPYAHARAPVRAQPVARPQPADPYARAPVRGVQPADPYARAPARAQPVDPYARGAPMRGAPVRGQSVDPYLRAMAAQPQYAREVQAVQARAPMYARRAPAGPSYTGW